LDNDRILERLETLEALIDKTEPDVPNEKDLFSMHSIQTQENIEWMRSIVTGNSNHNQDSTRIKLIQLMKDSNRIWSIRNKIQNGDWDNLEMLEVEDTIKDLLSQNQKINAIKYYRKFMLDELKVDMGLRQAKETIDAVGRGDTVDLSVGYKE
tara:strand:+ start:496 stop:954 length:459 start_codon:yes stop_codon:yes gene_type:complete